MSRNFTRNHLRISVLPTQLSKFLELERNPVIFLHHEIQRYLMNRIIYLEYEKYLQEKISFSEFSLFMCVWASHWVSLDICTRMFGFYFTLCLPPGNARWKKSSTLRKKSPEFCHFPIKMWSQSSVDRQLVTEDITTGSGLVTQTCQKPSVLVS